MPCTTSSTPGAAAGVYVSYNGGSGTKLCVATVAGGSTSSGGTSSGSTSSGNTSSGGSTSSTPDTSGMTEQQKNVIDAGLTLGDYSHEYEQMVFELTNQEREKAGLSPLVWAKSLTERAQERAKELETIYSHTRPDGTYAGWENISTGGSQYWLRDTETGQLISVINNSTPTSVVQSWMNSDGHRANILHAGATAMAVGCYVGEDGTFWWVQCFTSNDLDLIDPITTTPLL